MFERMAPERYDTLPEIPEPSENPLLAGHEAIARMLAQTYREGRLHHAMLFAGPQGIGKATLAFHFARHIFSHPDPASAPAAFGPTDTASTLYRRLAQDAHPSLLHLTRPWVEKDKKFKTVITVEEIRRVSRFLSLTAPDGGYRVVMVDPADDMNNSAGNALLKNLEEPPPRTLFILVAHSLGRILPTIRSRCQIVRFHALERLRLLELLEGLNADLPGEAGGRETLLDQAAGSARNAVLMTQYGGLEIAQTTTRLLEAPRFDVAQAQRLGDAVSGRDKGVQFAIFNSGLLGLLEKRAAAAARGNDIEGAGRLSALWEQTNATIREAEIYNLDRKQHVVDTLAAIRGALATMDSGDRTPVT